MQSFEKTKFSLSHIRPLSSINSIRDFIKSFLPTGMWAIQFPDTTFLKLIIIPIILFFLTLFPTGCTPSSSPGKTQQVFRYALKSDPRALNPILASEMASITVNSFMFNGLVKYDGELEIVPDLAESWEVLDGGKRIVFHLRK